MHFRNYDTVDQLSQAVAEELDLYSDEEGTIPQELIVMAENYYKGNSK